MNRTMGRWALAAAAWLMLTGPATAAPLVLDSPVRQVAVLELFTSHGCSSCPPADRWLRTLAGTPGLWREVVPLSFHVDYWDDLGWPDRFARAEFSGRQRAYYRAGALQAVYTPAFVLNGREWRGWAPGESSGFSLGEPVGRLRLEVATGTAATLRFDALRATGPLRAHLAVLGFGLATAVGGGENTGKTLREDFVVLGVTRAETPTGHGTMQWRLPWPELKTASPTRLAVVAWVSAPNNPRPVQAVGGWLPR